ncbi:MAG: hypothetical protein ACE5K0_01275 [Candidatus Methanofastidiosia archaeon]
MDLGTLFGLGITAILVLIVLLFIIGAFFIWIGAKLAGVRDATFGKALICAVALALIGPIFNLLLSFIGIGGFIGFILGLLVTLYIIKSIFDTSWGKAFVVWILSIVAMVASVFLLIIFGLM